MSQDTRQESTFDSPLLNSNLNTIAVILPENNYSTQDAILLVESMLNENFTTKNSTYYAISHETNIIDFSSAFTHSGNEIQNLYDQASSYVNSLDSDIQPIAIDVSKGVDGEVLIDVIFPNEPECSICPETNFSLPSPIGCDPMEIYNQMFNDIKDVCPVSIFPLNSQFYATHFNTKNTIYDAITFIFFDNLPMYRNVDHFINEETVETGFFPSNGTITLGLKISGEKANELYCELFSQVENNRPTPNHILIGVEIVQNLSTQWNWTLKLIYALPVTCDCPPCQICC